MFGVRRFFPIINPPQAAILGVGEITKRAVVGDDGAVGVADVMALVLVSDHRILYGADAARFLARVRELLEQPDALAG
jgi:pyruvate dehydrogenase E2 component (dihydrolipoamide acetyltransferase)